MMNEIKCDVAERLEIKFEGKKDRTIKFKIKDEEKEDFLLLMSLNGLQLHSKLTIMGNYFLIDDNMFENEIGKFMDKESYETDWSEEVDFFEYFKVKDEHLLIKPEIERSP